jgi:outer membrane protein assembly factor BamB
MKLKSSICILLLLGACAKTDPILPGHRVPVFKQDELQISKEKIDNLGSPLSQTDCKYTVDSNNQIWLGKKRIFAGLPTESKIDSPKKATCHNEYVYAGLSTGELVKIDTETRDMAWTVDIFAEYIPTGGDPFFDILAQPVYNNGFVYAGGLGNAFCKIKDSDGKKVWCVPISVSEIITSTDKFNVVRDTNGKQLAVSNDGKVYAWQK